jgi:DNA-binding response OmpR family regulator
MSQCRIMIVDDEEDTRKIVAATLGDTYEVVNALDGLDALDKLDRYEPDLIILDVKMPLMNGIETCEAIRKNPLFKATPIMFLSAIDTREEIMKAYSAGGNLYITKPFDPDRLLKNIDLFLKMNPISPRPKRHTIAEIQEMERVTQEYARAPVQPAPPSSPEPPAPEEEIIEHTREYRIIQKPRIMLVDDDINVITMMSIALRDDFEVVKALDGLQAVERIIRYQPDIIVVDVMMPKMSGYQLCESLRRNATFRDMPIIVASAKSTRRDQEYAFRCGATSFIAKPFEPGRLVKLIEAFVKSSTFSIRKKQVSFEQIAEDEKEEKEKQRKREEEYLKRLQRSELKRHIDEKMQPPDSEKR